MFRSSWFYLLLLGLGLLTLGLVVRSGMLMRKDPGEPINAAMREALSAERPEYSTADNLLINQLYQTYSESPTGLRFVVLAPSTGAAKPLAGQVVAVSYTGRFLGGAVFAHSDKFTFHAGMGDVIKGWDEAVMDMKVGEERTLIVPWWLAYGAQGRPPTIPPQATLVFDVKLLGIQ